VRFMQAIEPDIFAFAEDANKVYAVSADASNVVFVLDGGLKAWSDHSLTCAFTNMSVLEVLFWINTAPHSNVKLEYVPGKVTLKKKQ